MAERVATPKEDSKKRNNRPELLSLDPSALLMAEHNPAPAQPVRISQEYCESIIFVWFDPAEQSPLNLVATLRSINDQVQIFTDSTSCLKTIKFSKEKIFFITSSCDTDLISMVHNLLVVEAIFIITSDVDSIRGDFPKLCGIFPSQEELLRALRDTIETFEQIQLESFAFEDEKIFLWSQIWKEQLTNRKLSTKRHNFIEATQHYYRDNIITLRLIDELDKSYRSTEVITWCFHSPFPSRFLHHAIRSHSNEQLNLCRFLFTDASRFFQQRPKSKLSEQYYRGMKISHELLDTFEAHVGRVLCTSGFFPCTKSRANALTVASMAAYRSDLAPVLFKVDCDASTAYAEIANKSSQPLVVFDVCMAFNVVYVQRGPITTIKLKTAGEVGRKIALDYIEQHKGEPIQSLLDELTKPVVPAKPGALPPLRVKAKASSSESSNDSVLSAEEIKAQRYAKKGDVDRALAIYKRIEPTNPRVLNMMGHLAADKKQDYSYAVKCHQQALKMLEEADEDVTDTLTDLGNAYFFSNQFDLSLNCHTRALTLRQLDETDEVDPAAIAVNLMGIANVHWARQEYPEAVDHTQRALRLRENIVPPNNLSIGSTLAILGNIYQDSGNIPLALTLCKQALTIFETILPNESTVLNDLRYTVGKLHLSLGSLDDAYRSFKQVVKIYRKSLPYGHPDLTEVEDALQQVISLRRENKSNS